MACQDDELNPEQQVAVENALVAKEVTLEGLLDLIDQHGVKTIDQVLEELHGRA